MGLATFHVSDIRALPVKGKVAERNPDRVLSVSGSFRRVIDTDAKGNPVLSEPMSYTTVYLDRADVQAEGFSLDLENGILTIAEGERGRKAAPGLSADAVAEILAAARESATADTEPA